MSSFFSLADMIIFCVKCTGLPKSISRLTKVFKGFCSAFKKKNLRRDRNCHSGFRSRCHKYQANNEDNIIDLPLSKMSQILSLYWKVLFLVCRSMSVIYVLFSNATRIYITLPTSGFPLNERMI